MTVVQVLTVMLFVVSKFSWHGSLAEQQVPCYFIFGDSLVDNGNNNDLISLAKANYRPYGVDFPSSSPTGRFSNGKTTVDVIAEILGFEDYIPSYASVQNQGRLRFKGIDYASAEADDLLGAGDIIRSYVGGVRHNILKGVNYGSGAAGILDESGKTQGERYSMNAQIRNHISIVSRVALLSGGKDATAKYLNTCLYSITVGSNDYLNNYYIPGYYDSGLLYTPDQFADILVQQYSGQLQTLYEYGARKVALIGVGQIGFCPSEIGAHSSGAYPTVYEMNDAAELFDTKLKSLVHELNANLTNAMFTFINNTGISISAAAELNNATSACCTIGDTGEMCERNTMPCSDRKEYVFYDNVHPSEAMNLYIGKAYYNASSADAHPFNIAQLVQF